MIDLAKFPAILLVLSLAACGGDQSDEAELAASDTLTLEPAHDPAAGMDRPPGGLAQTTEMVDLQGGSAGGEVTVTDRGDQSEVLVALAGATADAEHPGHIHAGRCDAIGGVVQPLEPISTDSTGRGTMTSNVEIAPIQILDGEHIVVYHGEGGRPLTCADLPLPDVEDQSSTI